MSIVVRLDPDESLTAECVSAEVSLGDARLPRSSVGVSLDTSGQAPVIRVRTLERIDEPVVTVTVSAGCGSRVARQFTLFPDPPGVGPAAPAVVEAANMSVAASGAPGASPPASAETSAAPAIARPASPSAPAPAPNAALAPAVAPRPAPPSARTPAAPAATATPAGPATLAAPRPSRAASEPAAVPRPRPRPQAPAGATASPRSESKAGATPASKPRLKLDAPAMSAAAAAAAASAAQRELALRAAEEAASAAKGAAAQAANRVAELEKGMEALRLEARANREALDRMTRQLAESQSRSDWMPVLMVAVLALAALAGVLGWRLRKRADQRDEWWSSNQASPLTVLPDQADGGRASDDSIFPVSIAPDSVMPEPDRRSAAPPAAAGAEAAATGSAPRVAAAQPSSASRQDLSSQATLVLPPGTVAPAAAVRDMSMEELLDLEQQAEFFTVLGQDDAAIDLLREHLRSTGGTVPLPYLKLMEIYRRMGDREAHERTRERFNQRFNALAPDWETDPASGRSLEDYPTVIQRLQRDWPRPVDAMATLETLLFRADGGQVFDLPAYREVLFLFGLAHDLLADGGSGQASRIDVMLPLGDDTPAAPRQTVPAADHIELDIQVEDQLTLPLPLDLPAVPDGSKEPGSRKN